jgi:hypothetical protein
VRPCPRHGLHHSSSARVFETHSLLLAACWAVCLKPRSAPSERC